MIAVCRDIDPLAALPLPAWRCGPSGSGPIANAAGAALLDPVPGPDWLGVVHPDDQPPLRDALRCADAHPAALDLRLRRAPDGWRWVRLTVARQGPEPAVTCVAVDVSDLRERQGLPEEVRFRQIFDELPAFVFIKDADNNIVAVNRHGADYFGGTVEEMTGRNAYDLYPEPMAREWHDQDRRVIESGSPEIGIESRFEIDGSTKWYRMDKVPLGDSPEGPPLVAGIGIDVSAAKVVERRLRDQIEDSEALVRILREREYEQNLILDNIPVMIGYKDVNNRILRVNRFAAETLGLPTSEIYGKHASTLFPVEAQQLHAHDLEVLRTRKPKLDIVQALTLRTGEARWYRMHVLPHLFSGGELTGVVFVAEDITTLRRLESDASAPLPAERSA